MVLLLVLVVVVVVKDVVGALVTVGLPEELDDVFR